MSCPLCKFGDDYILNIETISVSSLARVLKRQFGIVLQMLDIELIDLLECTECGLRFYNPVIAADEGYYNILQKHDWYYLADKAEYTVAIPFIPSGSRVLEIGAGKGEFARRIENCEYTGLEFSHKAIEMAHQHGTTLLPELVEDHARIHPQTYDVVCSFQVLEHVQNIRSFLDAAVACLKPGGLLVLSVPNDESFMGAGINNVLNLPPHHLSRWTGRSLENAGELLGLDIVALHREQLSDDHCRPYGQLVTAHAILRFMKKTPQSLMPAFESFLPRLAIKVFGRLIASGIGNQCMRPLGHSITAVFQKPAGDRGR